MKNETMAAIRNYRDLATRMSGELEKIDTGLRDDVRKKREAQVREKYEKHLTANIAKIREGREHFNKARLKAADAFRALMVKTLQANAAPGLAAVCDGLSLMGPEEQLEFARETQTPALALKAVVNIRNMDLEPQTRMNLDAKVQDLTKTYIDKKEIRDCAEIEKACLEIEAYENQVTEGSPHDRAAIGYRLTALERVIDTGEVTDKELAEALGQSDPVERLNKGHVID
jgi:hypothetical protein